MGTNSSTAYEHKFALIFVSIIYSIFTHVLLLVASKLLANIKQLVLVTKRKKVLCWPVSQVGYFEGRLMSHIRNKSSLL